MARKTNNKTDEGTREKILNAAWTLFQRNSTSYFTLAELADSIGLHYTVLYHYFRNKSDLEAEIIERHSVSRSQRLSRVCDGGGSGFDQLVDFIYAEMKQPPSNLLVRQYDLFADPYRTRVNQAFDNNVRELAAVIQQGMDDGSIRSCRPNLVSALILRILNRYANQNEDVLALAGLSPSQLAEQIALFVGRGILDIRTEDAAVPDQPFTEFPIARTSGSNLNLMLQTLIGVLNRRGYDSTSIPQVAAQIGLSKTSFYRFAASKEELLYLAAHYSLSLGQQVRQISRAIGRNALESLMHNVFYFRYLQNHTPGPLLHPAIFGFLTTEHARAAWDVFNAGRFDMIELLNEGAAQGLLRDSDAIAVQPMLTAVMNAPFRRGTPVMIDEVTTFMLRGISSAAV